LLGRRKSKVQVNRTLFFLKTHWQNKIKIFFSIFRTVVVDYDCLFHNLIKDKDEAEGKLKNEIIELTKERDHLQEDVIGVERAFDDLHRRFEKLKTKVEEFKKVDKNTNIFFL
jgi:peptidoglycan hydrolase CwlO-like protein